MSEGANYLIHSLKLNITKGLPFLKQEGQCLQPEVEVAPKKTLERSTQTFSFLFFFLLRSGSRGSRGSCNVCQCACRDVSTHAKGLRGLAPNQTEADGSRQTETKHAHSTVQCLAYLSLPVFLLLSDSASFFHPAPPPP